MKAEGKRIDDERVRKYVILAEERLSYALEINVAKPITEKARRYLSDAKFYFRKGDSATALASVCYSHGLLDGSLAERGEKNELLEKSLLVKAFVGELAGRQSMTEIASAIGLNVGSIRHVMEELQNKGFVRIRKDAVYMTPSGRSRIEVGLIAGVFDLIHPGHIAFLRWARRHVDLLTAIIACDPASRMRKGRTPIQTESDRLTVVSDLKLVDYACLGHQDDIYSPVLRIRPDILFLGKDQEADGRQIKSELARRGLKLKVLRSRTWDTGKMSKTTKIIERIKRESSR